MSNYVESKKKIEAVHNRYGEFVFRGGISHLMDVGIRHLTEENVKTTCEKIMQEDDTRHFMTNGFKCEIIKVAYDLAQIPHIDLLAYIQREMVYDVCDGSIPYQRAIELLKKCMADIEQSYYCNNKETYDAFEYIGFTDDEIEMFGFGYVLDDEKEEE